MSFKIQKYGWKPDVPDKRDKLLRVSPAAVKALPSAFDLRPQMPSVFEQNALGSCTSNATCGQVWFVDKTSPFEPSRLFVYYNTRILEGTVGYDSGASIRNSIKSVVKWGFPPESDWPYLIEKFKKKPPKQAYKNATKEKVSSYARVAQTPNQIKACIADGLPVNFGFSVYESFESDEVTATGIVPMPAQNEAIIGGHACLAIAYDDIKSWYVCRNSWGATWGDAGYFYMPYEYMHDKDMAADFWVVKAVP